MFSFSIATILSVMYANDRKLHDPNVIFPCWHTIIIIMLSGQVYSAECMSKMKSITSITSMVLYTISWSIYVPSDNCENTYTSSYILSLSSNRKYESLAII